MSPSRDFWCNRRVVITGHTGFKGAWLAVWLHRLGAKLCGKALPPETSPNLSEGLCFSGLFETHHADIRDAALLNRLIRRFAPEIVLHLAAQSLVRRGYREPAATFETNVRGTVNVLEAGRATPSVMATLIVTSDKCYAHGSTPKAFTEEDRLGGDDPYSASKACAELATATWRAAFPGGAATASARAGNVIGGGDWSQDRLIPDCIAAFAAGRQVVLRNPGATRPWQHVVDPFAGYLVLAERLVADGAPQARAWNFGPDPPACWPVSRLVEALAAEWGAGSAWTPSACPEPPEAADLAVDSTRARRDLGWSPCLDIGGALAWTAEWYSRHHAGEDPAALTSEQIARYMVLQGYAK